jgi:hypothetical protein
MSQGQRAKNKQPTQCVCNLASNKVCLYHYEIAKTAKLLLNPVIQPRMNTTSIKTGVRNRKVK